MWYNMCIQKGEAMKYKDDSSNFLEKIHELKNDVNDFFSGKFLIFVDNDEIHKIKKASIVNELIVLHLEDGKVFGVCKDNSSNKVYLTDSDGKNICDNDEFEIASKVFVDNKFYLFVSSAQ